jgi:FkbM family methyltransferase
MAALKQLATRLLDEVAGKTWRGKAPISDVVHVDEKTMAKSAVASAESITTTLRDDKYEYHFVCHSQKERRRAERMFEKEKGTIAWLDRELRPDDVFFDVGANIGVYTIFGSRRIGDKGAVVAFEPHIPNAFSLLENILANQLQDKVRLVTCALTNSERYGNFNYQSTVNASSMSQFDGNSYEGQIFEPVFVEVKHGCTLDRLCSSGVIPTPDIVKIDVDGLDFEVLQGMHGLITSPKRPRSIQIELGSDSKPKIMPMLAETGYVLKEKHWTTAGLEFISQGNDPEDYPHYGIFYHPDRT